MPRGASRRPDQNTDHPMNSVLSRSHAWIHALWIFALLVLVIHAGTAQAANRVALVIGNDAYRDVEVLETARADASAMARALEGVGFKVTLRLDVDDRGMKAAVRLFKSQLTAGDEAVFFYAGHGVQIGAENYLVPVNVGLGDEEQIKDESVPLRRVLEDMEDVKARFSLAIIDACRNNPFRTRLRSGVERGLIPVPAATGQMVIYSAGAGQAAIDRLGARDRDPNGVFTRVLLREINTPGVPVDRVVRKVRDQVVALARSVGHEQVPAIYDQTIGDFYFVPAVAAAPRVETPPPPVAALATPSVAAVVVPAPPPSPRAAPAPAASPAPVVTPPVVTPSAGAPPAGAVPAPVQGAARSPEAILPSSPAPGSLESIQVAVAARAADAAALDPRLAALEKEQSTLTFGRALTILLEPLTPQERTWVETFESNVRRLRYQSSVALGPVGVNGELQIGAGVNRDLVRISHQQALDFCAGVGPREACRIVFTSGKFDAAAFVQAARAGVGNDIRAYQAAWRQGLAQLQKNPRFPER